MSRVEYWDPDGLFPLVREQLNERLPLRNLHWSSASQPTRSIPPLNLEFVPAHRREQQATTTGGVADRENAPVPSSRRHQLPGWSNDPFLRLYLLRCDDKEAYKSVKREKIRLWVNEQSAITSSGRQSIKHEPHAASEWLVLHVVLPNTVAATEPRWTRDSGEDYEIPKEKSSTGPKWPGKKPRTLLERLRVDLNSSSKAAPDRIAQVRLRKNDIPLDTGPELPPPNASSYTENARDRDNAWADLVNKLKLLIIQAFDRQVSQYEHDIQEKEQQRSLPGWNFCTFFILKEGLAKVFENIGLVEDALRGYEELSVSLDSVVEQESTHADAASSTTFSAYTEEFAQIFDSLATGSDGGETDTDQHSALSRALDPNRKDYREMIAANTVSIFDFKCYILARRLVLMVRKGTSSTRKATSQSSNVQTATSPSTTNNDNAEFDDFPVLAAVCQLVTESIPYLARLLRHDINYGVSLLRKLYDKQVIDVVVAAWTYSAVQHCLAVTDSTAFPETHLGKISESKTLASHSEKRTDRRSLVSAVPDSQYDELSKSAIRLRNSWLVKAAASRANLCVTQRRLLDGVLQWRQWRLKRRSSLQENEEDEDLDPTHFSDVNGLTNSTEVTRIEIILGRIGGSTLTVDSETVDKLKTEYERLSDWAASLASFAGRQGLSHQLTVDLAGLKFNDKDYSVAAALLAPVIPSFSSRKWDYIETKLLSMYAKCMKLLNRRDDHVRTTLSLLTKYTAATPPKAQLHSPSKSFVPAQFEELDIAADELFTNTVEYSHQLPYDMQVPFSNFFKTERIDQVVCPCDDQDGFCLALEAKTLFSFSINVDKVTVCLLGYGDNEGTELLLESRTSVVIASDSTSMQVQSNFSSFGTFYIGTLSFHCGKITFIQDFMPKPETQGVFSLLAQQSRSAEPPRSSIITCYSRPRSFRAEIETNSEVIVGQLNYFEVYIDTNDNAVKSGQISLKSGTAGLRIHTSKLEPIEGDAIQPMSTPGLLSMKNAAPRSLTSFRIPFDIEYHFSVLRIRVDATYHTSKGTYLLSKQARINIKTSVNIDVRDNFKSTSLFMRFHLTSTLPTPIRIHSVHTDGNELFNVEANGASLQNTIISKHNQICALYKIKPYMENAYGSEDNARILLFTIKHQSLAEEVIEGIVQMIEFALKASPYWKYLNLLGPMLKAHLASQMDSDLLEVARLQDAYPIPSIEDLGLAEVYSAMPPIDATMFDKWFRDWHEAHPCVVLNPDRDSSCRIKNRSVSIQFPVPQIDLLHTARLSLMEHIPSPIRYRDCPILTTGVPARYQLTTSFTTRWAVSPSKEPQVLILHFRIDSFTWAICGPETITFTSLPEEVHHFELTLLPLQPGLASLPLVEIESRDNENVSTAVPSPDTSPAISAQILSPTSVSENFQKMQHRPDTRYILFGSKSSRTDHVNAGQVVQINDGVDGVSAGLNFDAEGLSEAEGTVEVYEVTRSQGIQSDYD